MIRRFWALLGFVLIFILMAGCGGMPAMEEPAVEEPAAEEPAAEQEVEGETAIETIVVTEEVIVEITAQPTAAHTATPGSQPTETYFPTPLATEVIPTPTAIVEPRIVEVEWPEQLHLGDSDVVRMALIPTEDGYTLTTEFPDHTTTTQDVPVIRPAGYELFGVGQLNGVGFTIAPTEDQIRSLPLDETVIWHWSLTPQQPGRQRITVTLLLRWVPTDGTGTSKEAVAYSKGLEIQVRSFFGLTRRQAMTTGLFGAVFGGGLSLLALIYRPTSSEKEKTWVGRPLETRQPNLRLSIECPAGVQLTHQDEVLLRSLFSRYKRLVIQSEFLSGYSGARTFLVLPIRTDERADAPTIAKIGNGETIRREYHNFETFVKHTLPPVTARIQTPPVTVRDSQRAAIQYTFIGEPGSTPTSLRDALHENPNPGLLLRLFETFGPNWWMQRTPWVFCIAQEYDQLLPPHWIIEPEMGRGLTLDGHTLPGEINLSIGDQVTLRNFASFERRADGISYSIKGERTPGHPRLRIRWLGGELPKQLTGRVVATRDNLLQSYVAGFDLFGLPDPIARLPKVLNENVTGTRSTIHGDLNLENILVGPGDLVWLIDFATTRDGHPLADFAHLEAEIIAHVMAPQIASPHEFAKILKKESAPSQEMERLLELRNTIHSIAEKCLANPSQQREYALALFMACMGALKYRNLEPHQKHMLYLTAAFIGQRIP